PASTTPASTPTADCCSSRTSAPARSSKSTSTQVGWSESSTPSTRSTACSSYRRCVGVYATATGANRMVTLDEDTGEQLAQAPTGDYPDGLAYDPDRDTIWTTNETGGSETVIDVGTGQVRGTVQLGGEAGNVAYDRPAGRCS